MPGYADFAGLLATCPDLFMLRKFSKLTVQTLLYQQAELTHLERELNYVASRDAGNPDTAGIHQCWKTMDLAFAEGKATVQKGLVDEVQVKLKSYHESLVRTAQVQQLAQPSEHSRSIIEDWLSRSNGGNNFMDLCEAEPWESINKADLASLNQPLDGLDQLITSTLLPIYHRLWGCKKQADIEANSNIGPVWKYKPSNVSAFGTLLCMAISCGVPLASIVALYFARTIILRLALISLFTILFSIAVAIMTDCRRLEIFAATAAFAAVQVVFLQSVSQFDSS